MIHRGSLPLDVRDIPSGRKPPTRPGAPVELARPVPSHRGGLNREYLRGADRDAIRHRAHDVDDPRARGMNEQRTHCWCREPLAK